MTTNAGKHTEGSIPVAVRNAIAPGHPNLWRHSLNALAWGVGLGVLAALIGLTAPLLFRFLGLLGAITLGCVGGGLLLSGLLVLALRRSFPRNLLPAILFCATCGLLLWIGALHAVPRIYLWNAERQRESAVRLIEQHRQTHGRLPEREGAMPEDFPDAVTYWPDGPARYTLNMSDEMGFFSGWKYDSRTSTWNYWVD